MLGAIAKTFILGYYELIMEMVNSVIGRCTGMEVGTSAATSTAEYVATQPVTVADVAAVSAVPSSSTTDALSKYMPHSVSQPSKYMPHHFLVTGGA